MFRCICVAFVVASLAGCEPERVEPVAVVPVPIEMSGGWEGSVTVFSVDNDGVKTKVSSYSTSARIDQDGNWATVVGLCPFGTPEVVAERTFINSSFLYWEGTKWCEAPGNGFTYLAINEIHIVPGSNGRATGYIRGGFAVDDKRTVRTLWADISFTQTYRGAPAIGRWEGQVVTKMDGAPDDVRTSVVIVSRRSDGILVDGLCPRGDASVLLTDGSEWAETLCSSPWVASEEKHLVFEKGRVMVDGDTATITMTGFLAEPGGTTRSVTSTFVGARH